MLSHVSDGFRNVVTAHVLKCVANIHFLKFLVPAGGLCDEELYGLLSRFHGVGPSLANCDVKLSSAVQTSSFSRLLSAFSNNYSCKRERAVCGSLRFLLTSQS